MFHHVYEGDNLKILKKYIERESIQMVYIDPPYNTSVKQQKHTVKIEQSETEGSLAFNNKYYKKIEEEVKVHSRKFKNLEEYLEFLIPRLEEVYRVLTPTGSLFVHLDYKTVHYVKVILDGIFGPDSFMNEIIWAYDFGSRTRKKWSAKHNTILWYVKDPKNYTFNYTEMDRIPYMAPGLVGTEKAAKGKTPTDVWWHSIVNTTSKEKTGYPNQKPLGILNRLVKVHSKEKDVLLDIFAGSGSFSEAAALHKRSSILMDNNPEAIDIILKRLEPYGIEYIDYKVEEF